MDKDLEIKLREIKHNVLNILTSLKGQISLLEIKEDLSEKGKERCKKISEECIRIEKELKKIDLISKE